MCFETVVDLILSRLQARRKRFEGESLGCFCLCRSNIIQNDSMDFASRARVCRTTESVLKVDFGRIFGYVLPSLPSRLAFWRSLCV